MNIKSTPKERADELRGKFYELIPSRLMHYNDHKELAKNLALACLEEIIHGHYDFRDYALSGEERFYYDNVKRELEKL